MGDCKEFSLETTCRTCLRVDENLIPIFRSTNKEFEEVENLVFEECIKLKVFLILSFEI